MIGTATEKDIEYFIMAVEKGQQTKRQKFLRIFLRFVHSILILYGLSFELIIWCKNWNSNPRYIYKKNNTFISTSDISKLSKDFIKDYDSICSITNYHFL